MSNGTLVADDASSSAVEAPTTTGATARRVHRVFNHIVLIGVPLQFYAAGLAAFGAASFAMHARLGQLMIVAALLSFLVALFARRAGASVSRALVLFALVLAQPILAFAPRATAPWISAVHPVVGLAIGIIAWQVERALRVRDAGR